jgi:hypothetical protein
METDAAVAQPEKSSRWEDLIDVYFSPAELYARRAGESWVKPFLLLCAISIVLYYVFLPVNALIWEASMIANAPPEADLEKMRQGAAMMKYFGGIMVPIGYGMMIAGTALVMKLVSSVMEPGATWRQSFLIATYAAFVVIPQQILGALLIYIKSGSGTIEMKDASFGVLRFVEDPDKVLTAILGRFDIFPIWTAILCAVGLIVVVGMPRGKAFATAAITWLAIALPGLPSPPYPGRAD